MRKLLFIAALICSDICYSQMLSPERMKIKDNKKEEKEETDKTKERVIFYGLTSLNSSNDNLVENITASGRLAVQFAPTPNSRLKINMGANLLNANPSKGIKKDSVDFNSLMFPETGNFGFMFSPSFRIWPWASSENAEHSLHIDGTYSYRKVAIDSPDVSFKINSVNLGIKYMWDYKNDDPEKHFTFTLLGYWNLFNVPDEDVRKFNSIMSDSVFAKVSKGAEIYSVGLKTTVQYKQFIFFADLRRNIRTKQLDDNNPFKGTKFTIGFATSLRLKSF